MTVRAALAFPLFDDSVSGAFDEGPIWLKDVVLGSVVEMAGPEGDTRRDFTDPGKNATTAIADVAPDPVRRSLRAARTRGASSTRSSAGRPACR